MEGIGGLADGKRYFDMFADDAIFESRYHFPGWPTIIRGRADLMGILRRRNSGSNVCFLRSRAKIQTRGEYETKRQLSALNCAFGNGLYYISRR